MAESAGRDVPPVRARTAAAFAIAALAISACRPALPRHATVVDETGAPVEDAWVSAGDPATRRYRHLRTDALGRFDASGPWPADRLDVQVLQRGFVHERSWRDARGLRGATIRIARGARIAGRFDVAPSRLGLTSVRVSLAAASPPVAFVPGGAAAAHGSAVARPDGSFVVGRLLPGRYRVRVDAESGGDRVRIDYADEVEAGDDVDLELSEALVRGAIVR